MPRSPSIQIYLKPEIEGDERILALWEAAKMHGRPQEVFRTLMQYGLDQMLASGEISDRILAATNNLTQRPAKARKDPLEGIPVAPISELLEEDPIEPTAPHRPVQMDRAGSRLPQFNQPTDTSTKPQPEATASSPVEDVITPPIEPRTESTPKARPKPSQPQKASTPNTGSKSSAKKKYGGLM